MSDSVKIQINVATGAAEKALQRIQDQAKKTSTAFEVFQGTLAGGLAISALGKLSSAVVNSFGAAVSEASEAQREINDLNVALQNSGIYSEQTSQSLQAFADSIEATTTVSQGAVMQNLALLASMTNLDEQGLKKAQSAAIELSAAYNIDLQSATQLVAKAANGQTVGLQKLGLQFTKTGNDASTYANALQAIEKFSGTAASKTNTFEGQMLVMQNATQKLLESFGNLIVQNPILISGLQGFTNLIVRAAGWVDSFSKFIQNNVEWLEPLAFGLGAASFALGVIAVKSFVASGGMTALATTATAAWTAVTGPVGLVVAGIGLVGAALYATVKHWEAIKAGAYNALAATLEFASKGASVIGASGTSEALQKQAESYREKAKEARATYDAEKAAQDQTTTAIVDNNNKRRQIQTEEDQRRADLAAKRQKEIDDYTAKLAQQTEDIKFQNGLRLEAMQLHNENEAALENEWDITRFDARLTREQDFIAAKQAALDAELAANLERVNKAKLDEEEKYKARQTLQQQYNTDTLKLQTELNKKTIENRKAREDQEKKYDEQRLTASSNLFGALADVAATGGKESFGIWKALAMSEATIAGYLAVQKALASAPPPFNFVAAAAVGIQTALQLSKIGSTQPPAFQNGGIVPGNSFSGDNVIARVNSGEMVLNQAQQKQLFSIANGGGSNVEGLLVELIQAVRTSTSIQIDGREVFAAVRGELASGRNF